MDYKEIEKIVFECIDQIAFENGGGEVIQKMPTTVLFGEGGCLDSLGLVNLVVALESKVEERYGKTISLADERAMNQKTTPFGTIETLAEYIVELTSESQNG